MTRNNRICVESLKIKEIFNTMSYGIVESTFSDTVKNWLQKYEHKFIPSIKNFEKALKLVKLRSFSYDQDIFTSKCTEEIAEQFIKEMKETNNKLTDIGHIERAKILRKISENVKQKSDLICELACITKGVAMKSTKNIDIPIIIDYFQYYSSILYVTSFKHFDRSAYDHVLIILPDTNAICVLGMVLAPALAAGCRITLFVQGQLIPMGFLLAELCKDSGLPDEFLNIMCSDDRFSVGQTVLHKSSLYDKVVFIGDIECGKTLKYGLGGFPRDLSLLIRSKCSMIIHNDADLYSACDAVVENTWSHYGELPWNLYYVYVQESVYNKVINILKTRMDKIVIGSLNNEITDIGLQSDDDKLKHLLIKAEQLATNYHQCIDMFKDTNDVQYFYPVMFYDSKITDDDDFTPVLTVIPYRSCQEASCLVNNTRYGLAASIWSENESVVKELQTLLECGIVWINCYGLISAQMSLCPYKESGIGYFGGEEGLLNYMYLSNNHLDDYNVYESPGNIDSAKSEEASLKVESAIKAYMSWKNISNLNKSLALQKLANCIETNEKIPEEKRNWWVHILYEYSTIIQLSKTSSVYHKLSITTLKDSMGVIVIDAVDIDVIAQLITFAIANGNAVILVIEKTSFLSEICKMFVSCGFPSNLLTIVNTTSYLKQLIDDENVQSYWYEISSTDTKRFNRARHIDWRATYNLKKSFVFTAKYKFDEASLNMISSLKKSVVTRIGNSLNS